MKLLGNTLVSLPKHLCILTPKADAFYFQDQLLTKWDPSRAYVESVDEYCDDVIEHVQLVKVSKC